MTRKSKTILVTGGAGFIGSNFLYYWSNHYPQDKIINLDALTYAGNLENLANLNKDNYKFIHGNICDKKLIDQVMSDVDWVIHFAAESHVDRSIKNPEVFLETNVLGTHTLLDAALNHEIERFHHISTDEVYGSLRLESNKKFNLDTPYNPRSPYSASKASSDHLVRAYHHTYGLPTTISNCSNNYGPYQFPEKLISLAVTNLIEGKNVPVYGDGKNIRDWLYVEDHCCGVDAILHQGEFGKTYLLGGKDAEISNLKLVKKIIDIMRMGDKKISFVQDRPGHDLRYAIDWSKTKQDLGWEPKINIEQGLRKTIKWYQNHEQWWQELKEKNKKYYEKHYEK